ncbi:MAG: ParB/RepB/Spo0J family partition protein [Ignavibacteria bacterium]|nr:ParB/RepB/Spo0J family partition protein [Ignavibacteria bacterium]
MKQSYGLGKGLEALIPKSAIRVDRTSQPSLSDGIDVGSIALIDIDTIISANPVQPRRHFDEIALQELSNSIIEHGVITPITVRKHFSGYELISGERRLRASRMAGLTTIPAYVIEVSSNAHMLEIALVENVQREDLNPLEIAHGYERLIEECGLRQEDVAVKVGKDRSTVSNALRLLRLPPDLQASLRNRQISMGHARAMLALSNERTQLAVLREVVTKDLSVRKTEALVKDIELGRRSISKSGEIVGHKNGSPSLSPQLPVISGQLQNTLADIENTLRHTFSTQVRLKMKSDEEGQIEIEFYSLEELERLLDIMGKMHSAEHGT